MHMYMYIPVDYYEYPFCPGSDSHAAGLPFSHQPSYVRTPGSQQGNDSFVPGFLSPVSPSNDGDQSTSPKSPLSPCFSAPPIRHAALKSMFPQVCTLYVHTCTYLYKYLYTHAHVHCGSRFIYYTVRLDL